jgi:hypothetical protein
MNHFLSEMLWRLRLEEMLREAGEARRREAADEVRGPTAPPWAPAGRALIHLGRRLERMGQRLAVGQAGGAMGGLR